MKGSGDFWDALSTPVRQRLLSENTRPRSLDRAVDFLFPVSPDRRQDEEGHNEGHPLSPEELAFIAFSRERQQVVDFSSHARSPPPDSLSSSALSPSHRRQTYQQQMQERARQTQLRELEERGRRCVSN